MGKIEELGKIQELKNKGIITQEEFDTEKKAILEEQDNRGTTNELNKSSNKKTRNKLREKINKNAILISMLLVIIIIGAIASAFYINKNNSNHFENVNNVSNIFENTSIYEEGELIKQQEFKSIMYDYYAEGTEVPDRADTKINGVNVVVPAFFSLKNDKTVGINVTASKDYVEWAHINNYEVWAMFSNSAYRKLTSDILEDITLRTKLVNIIVELISEYQIDGINIDFEYMYATDKDNFSKFVEELSNKLNEKNITLAVSINSKDLPYEYSKSYDRERLAEIADYIIFMGYDQSGLLYSTPGTDAGADWVEDNIKELMQNENIDNNKIILGIPFYTRIWKTKDGETTSSIVHMKDIDKMVPQNANKVWNDKLKQYYVEYEENGIEYKMWIEDEKSIKAKLDLVVKYNLAGASFWTKDWEKESEWEIIDSTLEIK